MEASSICYNSFIELWLTHPGSRSVKCRGRWFLAHSELCIHRDCQAPWRRRHPERHPQLRASPPARARLCSRLSAVLSGRFQQAERTRVALCIRCSRRARRSRLVRTQGAAPRPLGVPVCRPRPFLRLRFPGPRPCLCFPTRSLSAGRRFTGRKDGRPCAAGSSRQHRPAFCRPRLCPGRPPVSSGSPPFQVK